MASIKKRQPLPKFGEWDVNDPASSEGFTTIFNVARYEKRMGEINVAVNVTTENAKSQKEEGYGANKKRNSHKYSIKRKWFCLA